MAVVGINHVADAGGTNITCGVGGEKSDGGKVLPGCLPTDSVVIFWAVSKILAFTE